MSVKTKKNPQRYLLKLFKNTIKKNTLALKSLKQSIDSKCNREDIDKIIDLSTNVNEKLDIVYKIRNDIKIYKTVNTILTNHYIKETRDHENNIDRKIINLEKQIIKSYDDLKKELAKMAEFNVASLNKMAAISVASQNNSIFNNVASPVQNNNVFVLDRDVKLKDLRLKNEIYNGIIKKIDKLFVSIVSISKTYCLVYTQQKCYVSVACVP